MSISRGEEAKASPCDRCGAPSECGIWEHKVCYPCASDWYASPGVEAMAKRTLGMSIDEACRLWTEATAKWVKAFKRGAA